MTDEKRILHFPQQPQQGDAPESTARGGSNALIVSPNQEEPPPDDAARQRALFAWAMDVLKALGLDAAVRKAKSPFELLAIQIDRKDPDIDTKVGVAIADALHPIGRKRERHFVGISEKMLERILDNRLNDLKHDRQKKLSGSAKPDWTAGPIRTKDKKAISPVIHNLLLILRHAPEWSGLFAFNEFDFRVVLRRRPPWEPRKSGAVQGAAQNKWKDRWLIDRDETMLRAHLQQQRVNFVIGDIRRGIPATATDNSFHPVKDLFALDPSFRWDGEPRVETMFIKYFHAEDTEYVRAISKRFLMSGVARIFRPGCQLDTAVIIEGPQGFYKANALRVLAIRDPEWYSNQVKTITEKNIAYLLAGKLIVEIPEMQALLRAKDSARKAFLEQREDEFRPPWATHKI